VCTALPALYAADVSVHRHLLDFAKQHMTREAQARIYRRLVKDPAMSIRRRAQRLVERTHFREVALPLTADGDWDPTGWSRGSLSTSLTRHPRGRRVLERYDLPVIATMAGLRKVLGIKSARQLGYFLLASDLDDGPYTTFTIPKGDGTAR